MYPLTNQPKNHQNSSSQHSARIDNLLAHGHNPSKVSLVVSSRALTLLSSQSQQLNKTITELQQSNYFITSFKKANGDKLWLQEIQQAKQQLLDIKLRREQLDDSAQ